MNYAKSRKKKIFVIATMITVTLIIVIVGTKYLEEKQREKEQTELAYAYKHQNLAFPRDEGEINEYGYVGYEAINEKELYVALGVYNQEKEGEDLEVEDVKEYLSQEYNEDGTPRVLEGWPEIRAYEDWYFRGMGSEEIDEYWKELTQIKEQYQYEKGISPLSNVKDLSQDQIEELIKKEANPTYEIDDSVMGIN